MWPSWYALAPLWAVLPFIRAEVLTPPYFNIASNKKVEASSTCGVGVEGPELYCKLVGTSQDFWDSDNTLIDGQVCDVCDPNREDKYHPPSLAVDGTESYWLSPPLSRGQEYHKVNFTIDLGQQFHVAYVLIKMGISSRPGLWVLEKSADNGETYTPWQFFAENAADCTSHFGKESLEPITRDDSVICTTTYSKIIPLDNGEIIVSLLNNRPSANDFFNSKDLQEWTRATHVRLRLIKAQTLYGHHMSLKRQDPTVSRRYFYSIKDISIGGRCQCNGHADVCVPKADKPYKLKCECQHNTCGDNCEKCCENKVQKKWRQSKPNMLFECEECNCNGHTDLCVYSATVDKLRRSMDIHGKFKGGGVCKHCRDNTEGINCEKCKPLFYKPWDKMINQTDACKPCNCNGRRYTGNCAEGSGICECKQNYAGRHYNVSSFGYTRYPNCTPCTCSLYGTFGSKCDPVDGICPCKPKFFGKLCDECSVGFYNFPKCEHCYCNPIGATRNDCDKVTGVCQCKCNFAPPKCDKCANGYYGFPECKCCNCYPHGTQEEICNRTSGECNCKEEFRGLRCDKCILGYKDFPKCKPCGCSEFGSTSKICDISGKCSCSKRYGGKTCKSCSPGYYNYPECLPCDCDRDGSVGLSCNNGNCFCKPGFEGKHCDKCKPGFFNYPLCEACICDPTGVTANFTGCGALSRSGEICECKPRVQGRICNECRPLYWNFQQYNPHGCVDCNCYTPGVIGGIAECDDKNNGQCHCKMMVESRQCNTCVDGSYNLQESHVFGCTDCGCDIGGSVKKSCNKITGKCYCKNRITGRTCNKPLPSHYYPTLHQLKYEVEDGYREDRFFVHYEFDENMFPGYSWKGYAVFSHLQNTIKQKIFLETASFYQIILRYVNRNLDPVIGSMYFRPNSSSEAEQEFKVLFKPSYEPQFVTASAAAEKIPFFIVTDKGIWEIVIEIKGNLSLDYFVLMPTSYYEGNILLDYIRRPCTIGEKTHCLLFKYPSLRHFERVYGNNAFISEYKLPITKLYEDEQILNTLNVAPMPILSADQQEFSYELKVPLKQSFLILIDYVTLPNRNVSTDTGVIIGNTNKEELGRIKFNSCPYNWLCRQVVIDKLGKLSAFNFSAEPVTLTLKDNTGPDVAIESVSIVPLEKWTYNFIEPSQVCVMKDGECQPAQYPNPLDLKRIEFESNDRIKRENELSPDNNYEFFKTAVPLDHKHPTIYITGKVAHPGAYIFIVHYYQPDYPAFELNATIENNDEQNATKHKALLLIAHCPSKGGCRSVIHAENYNSAFKINNRFSLNLKSDTNSSVWLDYVLITPKSKFKDRLITEEPVNSVNRFRKECGQNYFYMDKSTSDFCKHVTFSLTTHFNNGVLKCECNSEGSLDLLCEEFGGQCKCRDNVIGRKCEKCKTGYFGFPFCKPCDCPQIAICESCTGKCICPDNVIGDLCDKCANYSWGYDRVYGCQECKCDISGVVDGNLQCDELTGKCQCKPNIFGSKCNSCKHGHYNFPHCDKCNCDSRGSINAICDHETGECFCKKNVEGPACDLCADGTFNLQLKNKDGCTDCFCFNRTRHCSSSRLFKSLITGMSYWTLASVKIKKTISIKKENISPEIISQHSIGVDLTHELLADQVVYFSAPEKYLRNRLTSYGGNLTYSIFCTTGVSGVSVSSADVILSGAGMQLLHFSIEQPKQSVPYKMIIELIETNFVLPNHLKASREQFMQVLQDLQGIYIRATYWEGSVTTRLSDVLLDSASDEDFGGSKIVMSVEQCVCPPNYIGLSCEECAPGYYRSTTGSYGGFCVPCRCNKHTNICDKTTGKCIGCRDNTTGDHCEKCEVGFHGDATYGSPHDCLICPCPLPSITNNFATSCIFSDGGNITCLCKEGYHGDRCESCAVGYFGSPGTPGESCKPCECSGNIDREEVGACDTVTGECILCRNNTAGRACEICKHGFFGDAVGLKNCQSCNCDKCGMVNCNHTTGECQCRPNVETKRCTHCLENYYGFNSCKGCKPCNCQRASERLQCDADTGQCKCKPGVTGRTCDKCGHGFWNYSSQGCIVCSCKIGFSFGVSCDPDTGTCRCLPGVIGDKCESCPHRWIFNQTTGCSKCDKCVHDLLDIVDKLHEQSVEIESIIEEIKNLAKQRKQRQVSVNNTIEKDLKPKVLDQKKNRVNANTLNREVEKLQGNLDHILMKYTSTLKKVNGKVKENLHDANKALKDLENIVNNVMRELVDVGETVKGYYGVGKKAEQDLQEAKDILNKVKNFNQELTEDLKKAKYYDERSENFWINIIAHKRSIDKREQDLIELNNRIKQLNERLQDLRDHSQNTKKKVEQINEEIKNLRDELSRRKDIHANILKMKNDAEQSLINTNGMHKAVNLSLLEATIASLKDEKVKRANLTLDVDDKNNKLKELKDLVEQAENKSYALEDQAKLLTSVAKQYLQDTNWLKAYKNIVDTLRDAYITSEEARNFSEKALIQTSGLGNRALVSKQLSADLENKALELLHKITNELKPEFLKEEEKLNNIMNLKDQLDKELQTFKNELENISSVARKNQEILNRAQKIEDEAGKLKNRIAEKEKVLLSSKKLIERLIAANQDSVSNVNDVKTKYREIINQLRDANSLEQNFRNTSSKTKKTNNSIKNKLEKLKQLVEKARDSVNSIKVGVTFIRDTPLEIRKPRSLENQAINNYFSLYFNTTEPNSLLFYLGNEKISEERARLNSANSEDFMALEIQDGHLKLTVDLGSGPTSIIDNNNTVINGHWYQVIVERTGKTIRLNVRVPSKSLQPTEYVKEGLIKGNSIILNLDRKTSKLFIGGFPPTFTPPKEITDKPYLGQMEEVFIGESPISLWNFENSGNPKPAIERNELINTTFTTGFRFNGNGYIIARNNLDDRFHRMSKESAVTLSFKTFSENGLLFLSKKGTNFMSIKIREGRIQYQFDLGEGLATMSSSKTYDDGGWHQIEASRKEKKGVLKVDGQDIAEASAPGTNNRLQIPVEFYIGGHPNGSILDVTNSNFDGCIDEVSFGGPIDLNKYKEAVGVIAGCPEKVASVMCFEEGAKGYVLQPNISATDFMELILRFITTANTGLLACAVDGQSRIALWLEDGQIIFSNGDDKIKSTSSNKYNDGMWHVVMAVYNPTTLQLFIDDDESYSSKELKKKPVRMLNGDLYFGGISPRYHKDVDAALKSQFSGCISDVTWNSDRINFCNLAEIPGKCGLLRPILLPSPIANAGIFLKVAGYAKHTFISYLKITVQCGLSDVITEGPSTGLSEEITEGTSGAAGHFDEITEGTSGAAGLSGVITEVPSTAAGLPDVITEGLSTGHFDEITEGTSGAAGLSDVITEVPSTAAGLSDVITEGPSTGLSDVITEGPSTAAGHFDEITEGTSGAAGLSDVITEGPSTAAGLSDVITEGPSTGHFDEITEGTSGAAGLSDVITEGPSTGLSDVITEGPSTAAGLSDVITEVPSTAAGLSDVITEGPSTAAGLSDVITEVPSTAAGLSDVITEVPSTAAGHFDEITEGTSGAAGLPDVITVRPSRAADTNVESPIPTESNPFTEFTEDCKLSSYELLANENTGHRFGATYGSRFEYSTLPVKLKNKYHFSIEIKTEAYDGVIFFAFSNKNNHFIALYLKDGKINYGFACGSDDVLLFSNTLVNDNKWHTIGFRRQGENSSLIIDEITVDKVSSNIRALNVKRPYFLGGLDPLMRQDPVRAMKGINATFEGCLRKFKLNGRNIVKELSIGVLPCIDAVEEGIYFSPDGGYIEQRKRFKVGVKFNVKLHIKPRSLSGLLLSIHGIKDYLVLELVNGTVRMAVNNGDGEISSTYIPPDTNLLCDGHWHTIQAIKSKHVITLAVDNDFKKPVYGRRASVNTKHILYLGAHPNFKENPGVLSQRSYVGCLKNLVINGVLDPIYIKNSAGSVSINACPTN